jgi:prepilin-type processing-associated H-X9-DG protein
MTIRLSEIQITKVSDVSSTSLQEVSGEVFYEPPPAPIDDGLLLPAVRIDDGEASIKDGTSNTVFFSERYPDGEYVLTGIQHGADDSGSSHSSGVNALMGDGSVRSTDTSAVATLMDFDFPSQDGSGDTIWVDMGAPPADTGYLNPSSFQIISAGNESDDSGSYALYQDAWIIV